MFSMAVVARDVNGPQLHRNTKASDATKIFHQKFMEKLPCSQEIISQSINQSINQTECNEKNTKYSKILNKNEKISWNMNKNLRVLPVSDS